MRFYGLEMGLTIDEVDDMRQGVFDDLVTCRGISDGTLIPVPRKMSMEEILAL